MDYMRKINEQEKNFWKFHFALFSVSQFDDVFLLTAQAEITHFSPRHMQNAFFWREKINFTQEWKMKIERRLKENQSDMKNDIFRADVPCRCTVVRCTNVSRLSQKKFKTLMHIHFTNDF